MPDYHVSVPYEDCQDCLDRFTCTVCEEDCECEIPDESRCDAHSCGDCERSYGPGTLCRCDE